MEPFVQRADGVSCWVNPSLYGNSLRGLCHALPSAFFASAWPNMCLNFFGRTDACLNQQCTQALDLELESSIYSEYPPNVLKCRSFGGCFEESLPK